MDAKVQYKVADKIVVDDIRRSFETRKGTLPVVGGTYILANRNSGFALDVYGESTADGGQIIQWPYHGGANQKDSRNCQTELHTLHVHLLRF